MYLVLIIIKHNFLFFAFKFGLHNFSKCAESYRSEIDLPIICFRCFNNNCIIQFKCLLYPVSGYVKENLSLFYFMIDNLNSYLINEANAELAFPVYHSSNSLYSKQGTASLYFKPCHFFLYFSSVAYCHAKLPI